MGEGTLLQGIFNGRIKFFDRKRGYGFIVSDMIEKDIFFHFTSINDLHTEILMIQDMVITFNIYKGVKGYFAKNIKYVESNLNNKTVDYKQFILFLGGVINEEIKKHTN